MIYKVKKYVQKHLLTLPESGFGYQIIEANDLNGKVRKTYVVFNSEIAVENDSKLTLYTNTLIGYSYNLLLSSLDTINMIDIKLLPPEINNSTPYSVNKSILSETNHEYEDIYIRPSIFINDCRIDKINKVLRHGTCITTLKDFNDCLNPFESFALPGSKTIGEIKYVRYQSSNKNEFQTIPPAFGKRGGGKMIITNDYGVMISSKENVAPLVLNDK